MSPLAAAVVLLAAADPAPQEEPNPYLADRHVEISMGFVGGVRDLSHMGFTFEDGNAESIPYAQALAAPFSAAPYGGVSVYGLGGEWRYVSRHIRITAGVQKPFASFRLSDAVGTYDVGGVQREVGTRSLSLWDFRFGLGAEYPFRYATPFVDVVGDMQVVSAYLTVDGQTADYRAWAFGFAVRAGVRLQVGDNMYLAPMGEYGIGGAVRWGAALQVGWVIPS
jgi:hypothetical protein